MLKKIISYLPVIGLLMVVATLPFRFGAVQRISLFFAGISYILDYVVNKRWQGWQWKQEKWVYVCFIALFAIIPIRGLFDIGITRFFVSEIEHNLPFLVFGIVGILGMSKLSRVRYYAYVMIAVSIGMYLYVFIMMGQEELVMDSWIMTFNTIRRRINSHMIVNMYCNTALILCFYSLMQKDTPKIAKVLLSIGVMGIFLATMISEGRIGVVTTSLIVLACIMYATWRYKRKWLAPLMLLGLIIIGTLVSLHPRLHETLYGGPNPRRAIWNNAWKMIRQEPIVGYGAATYETAYYEHAVADPQVQEHFIQHFIKWPGFDVVLQSIKGMHPHNAFLTLWLEYGIIAPVLLLTILLLPFLLYPHGKRLYVGLFCLSFFFQCMFEPLGIHLSTTLLTLILFIFDNEKRSIA